MTNMPHLSMIGNTLTEQYQQCPQEETLRKEEKEQGYLNEVTATKADPIDYVSDEKELRTQQGHYSSKFNTGVCAYIILCV